MRAERVYSAFLKMKALSRDLSIDLEAQRRCQNMAARDLSSTRLLSSPKIPNIRKLKLTTRKEVKNGKLMCI